MSDTNNRPGPNAPLRGDDKPMPDRGTSTGVTDSYGADLSQSAKNRKGRISGSTGSDSADDCYNHQPNSI
jgi:hypothetical protein